jgi:TolB-like protein
LQSVDARTFRFAKVTLDLARGELRGAHGAIELRPKSFDVLRYLVTNAGRLVTKDELLQAIWPDVIVTEESLSRCISDIRSALDDRDTTIIKTVPKRGYRFDAPLKLAAEAVPVTSALSLPEQPSIAVLPFNNLNDDPAQDYFADGLVEEITVALSRFKSLFVISRNSAFSFKSRAVAAEDVGRELGVRYILQGSVRKAGERVRVSCQLVDAVNGGHLWAETFEGSLAGIFDLHDEAARAVAGIIAPRLLYAEIERARRQPSEVWSAYDHRLRGMALLHQFTPVALDEAADHFRQALTLQPDYALAHAVLALCAVGRRFWFGQDLSEADRADALDGVARAARLAPDDDQTLAYCSVVITFLSDDLERAVVLAERAIGLNPNLALAWAVAGWANTWLGEIERARAAFDTAIRLNPLDRAGASADPTGLHRSLSDVGIA